METDPPAPENSDQAVVGTTDEQVPSKPARSYECTFCKRGFSNAQALGGHMNIHRKDKAKLKQASNVSNQQLLDIPKSTTNTILPSEFKSSTEEKSRNKWPWIFSQEVDHATSRDETHSGQLRQLPLFAETASPNENQELGCRVGAGAKTEKGVSSSQEPLGPELDLELRLGHEPQDSLAATGMKKFF